MNIYKKSIVKFKAFIFPCYYTVLDIEQFHSNSEGISPTVQNLTGYSA